MTIQKCHTVKHQSVKKKRKYITRKRAPALLVCRTEGDAEKLNMSLAAGLLRPMLRLEDERTLTHMDARTSHKHIHAAIEIINIEGSFSIKG